jgi:hypothetical protein
MSNTEYNNETRLDPICESELADNSNYISSLNIDNILEDSILNTEMDMDITSEIIYNSLINEMNIPVNNQVTLTDLNKKSTVSLIKKENEKDKCAICCENYKENKITRKLDCTHTFHMQCIDKWFENNNSCPLCRKYI